VLDRFPTADFAAAGREVAARKSDPYTILDGWLKSLAVNERE
jgi:hypothetical protein